MTTIDSLEDLERWVRKNRNARLIGVIKRFKYSNRIDERILALASMIQSMRRKRVQYTDNFLHECLFYLRT